MENRVPVMAGNDFEIKENLCPHADVSQQVTEVGAPFAYRTENAHSRFSPAQPSATIFQE
jgi:hypothetical protein